MNTSVAQLTQTAQRHYEAHVPSSCLKKEVIVSARMTRGVCKVTYQNHRKGVNSSRYFYRKHEIRRYAPPFSTWKVRVMRPDGYSAGFLIFRIFAEARAYIDKVIRDKEES